MIPSLASLIKTNTAAESLSLMLEIAADLGLSTTSWGPFGMLIAAMETMATIVSLESQSVSAIAQGGYASTAAAMTDGQGNEIATWMDLVGSEQYGVVRSPAVQAEGVVALANVGAMQGPCAAGSVHFRHPSTGATYSNTLDGEFIAAGTALAPVYVLMPVEADVAYPGSNGNAVQGVTLSMTTPFPGVSVCALGTLGSSDNLVGTDAELNFAFLARCKKKLQAISPDGADGALKYVAETPSIVALFGTVSAPITRARRWLDYATGIVWLWIANADGPALAGDVAVVQEAEQALAVPTGMDLVVAPATDSAIQVVAWIYTTGPVAGLDVLAANAVASYFASLPIGGTNLALDGVVPLSGILSAIQAVIPPAVTGVNLVTPGSNVVLGASSAVPTLATSSAFFVVRVAPP
jgi:uncharacterized phage protein gp47/JayE